MSRVVGIVDVLRLALGATQLVETHARKAELREALAVVAHDIECGMHSGIPPCCIAWFILVRKHMDDGSPEWLQYDSALANAAPARRGKVGYAPCPECVAARRFVRVKNCACKAVLPRQRTLANVSQHWRQRKKTAR